MVFRGLSAGVLFEVGELFVEVVPVLRSREFEVVVDRDVDDAAGVGRFVVGVVELGDVGILQSSFRRQSRERIELESLRQDQRQLLLLATE